MFRCILFIAALWFSLSQAYGRDELKAYDAYFCPVLELTEEQKSELIPHIQKRHWANRQNKFKDRTDATVFGVDLSQSKAAKDLNQPEDEAVRKILKMKNARKLEQWLEENESLIEKAKKDFPLLEGNFFRVHQQLTRNENSDLTLQLKFEATVPSPQYRLVMDEMTREGNGLIVKMSIVKPHHFKLFEESPGSQQIAHEMKIDLPHPEKIRMEIREVAEFDLSSEYHIKRDEIVLQASDLKIGSN